MSTLVAIAYPDADTAEKVRTDLVAGHEGEAPDVAGRGRRHAHADGKIKLHQAVSTAGAGAAGGALWAA